MSRVFPHATTDYLVNASSSPVTGAGPWTMACWARPTSLAWPASFGCPFSLGRNAALHLGRFTVNTSGLLTFQVYDGANGAATAGNMTAGAWGHVVGVKRSATNQQAYLNGTGGSVNTTSATPTLDRISVGICRYTGANVIYPWNGEVAWPAIWNIALSDAEITALARGAHPYTIRPQNLVWFAPLHNGTAGDIDIIGGINLTEVGTVTEGESRLVSRSGAIIIPFPTAASGGTTFNQAVAGSLTPTGVLLRMTSRLLTGSTTGAGAFATESILSFAGAGSVTPSGGISRMTSRGVAGSSTPAGTVSKTTTRGLSGSVTAAGNLARETQRKLVGVVTAAGAVSIAFGQAVTGAITATGALASDYLSEGATSAGTYIRRFWRRFRR